MRRVLISLGAVAVTLLALVVALPFTQARRLSKQLISDVAALRARELPRVPAIEHPLHDNGFECLRQVLQRAPRELDAFVFVQKGVDVTPWVRGEQPLETLPAETAEKLERVAPWVEELRRCGSSRALRVVDGVEPWSDFGEADKVFAPLVRTTSLQVRRLLASNRAEEAAGLCEATFETVFDVTHVNLISAMLAQATGRDLLRPCSAALGALPPAVRGSHAARWRALPARFVTVPELLETERLNMSAIIFLPLTSEPQLAVSSPWTFYDGEASSPQRALMHYAGLGTWSAWDARMRALVKGDFTSSRALPGVRSRVLPGDMKEISDYAPFVKRIDAFLGDFEVLVWLADGAHDAPPLGTRVDGGVELPSDGGVWFLPIAVE